MAKLQSAVKNNHVFWIPLEKCLTKTHLFPAENNAPHIVLNFSSFVFNFIQNKTNPLPKIPNKSNNSHYSFSFPHSCCEKTPKTFVLIHYFPLI